MIGESWLMGKNEQMTKLGCKWGNIQSQLISQKCQEQNKGQASWIELGIHVYNWCPRTVKVS